MKEPKPTELVPGEYLRVAGFLVCVALGIVSFVVYDTYRDPDPPLPAPTNAVTNATSPHRVK